MGILAIETTLNAQSTVNPDAFDPARSPGRLEPTEFHERTRPGGPSRVVRGHGFVPHALPAGLSNADFLTVQPELLVAERNLSTLEGFGRRLENPGMLMGSFAHMEARHSSAIEDTFASDEQLVMFDVDRTSIESGHRDQVSEVHNYLRALHQGFADERPICLNLIRDLHRTLVEGARRVAGRPGEFRTTQNAIGTRGASFEHAKFVPPPTAFLGGCLDELESFIHRADDLPRLIRIALVHYQFECIHPFEDGNGRLGRLLIALQLCKQGLLRLPLVYVSGYLERHRERYYDLLSGVSLRGEWVEWVRFFLRALGAQAHDALLRAERLEDLRSSFYQRVQQKRASAMLPRLVDHLLRDPGITIAKAAEVTGMGPSSASRLVARLEDVGILREATGKKHSRVFVAPEILAVLGADLSDGTES